MIRLGNAVIEAVSLKTGDEGHPPHWEVRRHRGRLIGYSITLHGAVRIAAQNQLLDQDLARRTVASIESALADLHKACRTLVFDPASGGVSRQETTSAPDASSQA